MACVVAFAILLAGTFWLHSWWVEGRFVESTDDAFVAADITSIASKVPGFITRVAVRDNQQVHAGDLLVVIDDRDYRSAAQRAEAGVKEQEATLANLDALSTLQEAAIEEARAQSDATEAELRRTADDARRARDLSRRDVVSAQDFEHADAEAAKAEAVRKAAAAAVLATERQLTVLATQKKQAQARLAQEQAALDLAQLDISYTEIRSPIDGVVGNRRVRIGDYATTGGQLLSIVPANGLYVEANFKESQIASMRPGQQATIEADVLRRVKFRGEVESLAPATGAEFSLLPAENATGNFTKIVQRVPVRIRLEGADAQLGLLRPGLSVEARVVCR